MSNNIESYPEWLESLVGESPLLSSSKSKFIANIRSQIISEIKSKPKLSLGQSKNLKKKLSAMKNNFKEVVEHLKKNRKHRQYFIDMYPRWRSFRDDNVHHLRNIANLIEEERQNCQNINFIGSCISLMGGAISLAAGVKSNHMAETGGSVMVGLGALTSAGSSAAEYSLLSRRIKEAENVMREDKECSQHLWDWLSDGSYLHEAMDNIRYIDVDMKLKQSANTFQNAFKKYRNGSEIEKIIKNVMSQLNVSPEFAEEISDIIGIFIVTSMLYDDYRPVFNRAFASKKLKLQLSTAVDLFRAAVTVNQVCRMKGHGGKVAASMVYDVVNIVLVRKDWKSISKQAGNVRKAADVLEKEAQEFENLFNEIQNFDDDEFPYPIISTIGEMKASVF